VVGHHKKALGIAEGGKEEGVGNNDALLQGVAATEWHVEVVQSSWSGVRGCVAAVEVWQGERNVVNMGTHVDVTLGDGGDEGVKGQTEEEGRQRTGLFHPQPALDCEFLFCRCPQWRGVILAGL
jgi:hypothetical protein